MKIAFIIYNRMTTLDFLGAFDAITRLKEMEYYPDLSWEICAMSSRIKDAAGLTLLPDQVHNSLGDYDMILVPGSKHVPRDDSFIEWIQTAEPCPLKVSVCSGSLILGMAGFLTGKRATTHPNAFNELARYAGEAVDKRVVDEGNLITARGVTSSIDLGLYMCEKLAGREAREAVAGIMDYDKYETD